MTVRPAESSPRARPCPGVGPGRDRPRDGRGIEQGEDGIAQHLARFGQGVGGNSETGCDRLGVEFGGRKSTTRTLDTTFGAGRKARGDTSKRSRASPQAARSRASRPCPRPPGTATTLCATSRCEHHHQTGEEIVARQQPTQNGGADRVREICGHLPRRSRPTRRMIEIFAKCVGDRISRPRSPNRCWSCDTRFWSNFRA